MKHIPMAGRAGGKITVSPRVMRKELQIQIRDLENRAHEECSREGTTRPETIKELRQLRCVRDGMT